MPTTVRQATTDDIAALVGLLADDPLGATRETPDDLRPYQEAFRALADDPRQYVLVAEDETGIVGTLQLTVVPGLARTAASRGQIEGVRVRSGGRGAGVGSVLMRWAIDEARARGCRLVQLTSDNSRTRAHDFYERLGFTATHVGYKLEL
ncbi:MAG: GNAT family N-acetyltransferase [Streptosporangiales bacterium]|nr:GNAT family N-acetyltransferase [Streptosporangiales bacterium]